MNRLFLLVIGSVLLTTFAVGAPREKRNECPPICYMHCEYGFVKDENDCDTCQCECPPHNCRKFCEHGFIPDENGCDTCDCMCSPIQCTKFCDNGFEEDENGCELCVCRDTPAK